ncbi:L-type lectin-domain containing receptor kinase IV.2, partial [Bienertia sinuspersici]
MAKACAYLQKSLALFFFLAVLTIAQDEKQFIYNGFQGANLHLDGLANIHPDGLLQMTNETLQQSGHVFYPRPFKFNTSHSFSTTFTFAINTDVPGHGGHGIAFVIASSTNFEHAVPAEYLGIFNFTNNGNKSNHVFAIELDTVQNAVFGDIDGNHVGIDVNGLTSVDSASAAYYSDEKGMNMSLELSGGSPMQIWIDYDGDKTLMNVTMSPLNHPKPKKYLLSTRVDLSPAFLDSMYVGFSSSTGLTATEHYISGWSWSQIGQAQDLDLSKLPSIPRLKTSKKKLKLLLIILIVVLVLLLEVIAGVAFVIWRKKYEELKEPWEQEYISHRFSFKDLYLATKGFKDSELLGFGGFGKVYKGVIPSTHTEIAVKKVSHDSKQGTREFVAEVVTMRRLRHRNLVQLLGYCRRKGELLLVYDYMPNGSLDKFLFKSKNSTLSWSQRFNVVKGVASALVYLHEEWEQVVLHRDVKASNVMLDAEMNARLGDFGLARLYDHESDPRSTRIVGTVGYLAPELSMTGKPTTATDVFAFGMFLLEVACGKRPNSLQDFSSEDFVLVDWVYDCWKKGVILETSDPKLEGYYQGEEMELVLKLGLLCSYPKPEGRPSMRQAVQFLHGDANLPDIPSDYDCQSNSFFGGSWEISMSIPTSSSIGISHATLSSNNSLVSFIFSSALAFAQDDHQFIYNGFQGANLHLDGLATIQPNGLLVLTNTSHQLSGHVFYPQLFHLNATRSFSTSFVFAMYPDVEAHGGHGIAFVISPTMNFEQAVPAEYLGLFNISSNGNSSNHILAVELDTIQNAVFGDIDGNHVGVDVNGLTSNVSASAAYYDDQGQTNISLQLTSREAMQVWIDYDGDMKLMNVTLAPLQHPKPSNPLLSTHLNLSSILLESMYVGFSASTGLTANEHYLLGWSWSQNGQAQGFNFSELPPLPKVRNPKGKLEPIFITLLAVFVLLLIIIAGVIYAKRRKMFAEVKEPWEEEYASHRFSFKDLYVATKGFKDSQLLGSGGFGKVYKGTLPSTDTQVAIKRVSHDSNQGMREFVSEIVSMRSLRHRNLIQLLGYCRRKGELLLVYEFMPNGSLDKLVFPKKESEPKSKSKSKSKSETTLSWIQRMNIAKGVASALLYLHEEWEQVVLHRDVKASNVLLDADMNAKLGDFGLARLYDHGSNPHTTNIVGTVGYLAPELSITGKPTPATDVFAFGIFLLELACGVQPFRLLSFGGEDIVLVDWVFDCWKKGAILETSDPKLEGYYDSEEMQLVLKLGLHCSHPKPEVRPSMRHAVQFLHGDAVLPDLPSDYDLERNGLFDDCWGTSSSFRYSFGVTSDTLFTDNSVALHFWTLAPTIFAQDSKNFIYHGFQDANLHLDGAATIHSNGLLQLTNYTKQLTAHAFHPIPLNFSSSSPSLSFSTSYIFAMYPEIPAITGHGIVFLLSPSMDFHNGVPGKFFGLFNSSSDFKPSDQIFAVELDTIQDYEFLDVDSNHVGIDINSLISNVSAPAAYFSDSDKLLRNLSLVSAKPMQIWVDYNHDNMKVEVTISPFKLPKPSKPLLSLDVNLSDIVSDTLYVGFSSSTGSVASSHYLLGWSFAQGGMKAQSFNLSKLPQLPRYGSRGRKMSVGSMILVIVISVIVVAIGLIYYIIRRKKFEEVMEDWEQEYLLQRFSFKDLYRATKGFKDKELTRKGKATTSTDVFSFGVFILEVACGRSPIGVQDSNGETYLIDWVYDCWKKGAIVEASDPKLGGNYVVNEMELVLKLGMFCCHPRPEGRPNMRQVMQFLNGDSALPETLPFDAKPAHTTFSNQTLGSYPISSEGASAYASYSSDSILKVG